MNFTEMNEQQCYLLDMYHSSIQYNYALPRSNLYSITQKPAKVRSSSITSQKLKAGLKTKQNQPQTITTYMSTQVTWCLGDTNKYWNKAIKQALYWHTGSSVAGLVWNKTKNSCHCHKSYIRIKEEADHLPLVGTAGNCCGERKCGSTVSVVSVECKVEQDLREESPQRMLTARL